MKTVAILSQKGGVGKTTLALLLAVEAERRKKGPVAVIDLDPQASAAGWGDTRESETPDVQAVPHSRLLPVLVALQGAKAGLVVIDTPPQVEGPALAAARASDAILIPVRPNIADLRAIGTTVEMVRLANKPAAIVLTQGAPSSKLADARTALEVYGLPVCPAALPARKIHADAWVEGKTAAEVEPQGKAAAEIRALFDWLNQQGLV